MTHTHTPLALMILRNQWDNALNMLESGAYASTKAEASDSIFFADSPLWAVMVKVFDEDNSVQEKVCEKLCEAFYKESDKDTSEWCEAYVLCMNHEKNLIRNLHYLLKDQKRAAPWMQKMSFGYNIRETALPFSSPIKIDQLKEMAYHDFKLSSYFYQSSEKEYSTYIFHPLITLAPEALETWLEQDVQKGHHIFQALMKVKTIGMDSLPYDFVEKLGIPKEKKWYKDENPWILAMRSSHPKMVLNAFKKFNAPQDFLYDSSSQHQDIWEIAMVQKSGERLVEFLCQEFGGPKWEGRDGNCSEMYHWMSKPRNEDEIESVLSMNILKLDRVVSKKTNNTLLHRRNQG